MFQGILLFLIPSIFAGILCYIVGTALPAVIIGSLTLVLGLLSIKAASAVSKGGTSGGLGIVFLFTIPLTINGFLLLFGSGIYYLCR